MEQGSLAQWKLFDDIDKQRRGCRPFFTKLDEGGFDLWGI